LKNKRSLNFYVVHGGTNFGFWAGANAFTPTQYQPDLTSYDYDSPINEQGQPTAKYFALRKLISKYVTYKIPAVPKSPVAVEIPVFELRPLTSIWNNLPKPVLSAQPIPMEMFDQTSGFVMYRTTLIGHKSGSLTITEPHDYALVLLNGKLINTIYRDGGRWTIELPKTDVKNPVLEILVEGMGRINFAQYMIDRKGITDRVTLNGMTLMNWEIFSLPLGENFVNTLQSKQQNLHDGVFFEGEFNMDKPADTYLDMSKYAKGVVWVNGNNLGRFWEVGPQKHLYCPANFLLKGANHVVVLDLLQSNAQSIKGVKTLE
jgi:beta-galactosidase